LLCYIYAIMRDISTVKNQYRYFNGSKWKCDDWCKSL